MEKTYGYTDSHDKVEILSKENIEENYYNKVSADTNFAKKSETYTKEEADLKILSGTEEPSNDIGEEGSIYIKYEE